MSLREVPGLGHLPAALVTSAVVLVLAAAAGWLARGGAAAAGAAAGVALVAASYLVSAVAVARAAAVNPRLVMPVGMATYVIKIVLLGLVMLAIVGAGWDGATAMGVAIIPAVLGWIAAQLCWTLTRGPDRRDGRPGHREQPSTAGHGDPA